MKFVKRYARQICFAALATILPLSASAKVRKEGTWPEEDKKVSFRFEGRPSEGLSKLAEEAGWSLVVSKGISIGEHDVRIAVEGQPADAILEALFEDGDVVARRNGQLLTITGAGSAAADPRVDGAVAAVPAVPAVPPVPPSPAAAQGLPSPPALPSPPPEVRGEDRSVLGGALTIEQGETVHTVTVTGGSVKVRGTVTGNLVVTGGSAKIESGAHVYGNATALGGSLKIERGARVDGDVGVIGGSLKREEGAIIGGEVVDDHHNNIKIDLPPKVDVDDQDDDRNDDDDERRSSSASYRFQDAARAFGNALTFNALLFVVGAIFLALGTRRMEALQREIATRPMRSFAIGIVSGLASFVAFVILCVTIVGIPVALLGLLVGIFAVYAAIAAVLTTFGAAILGHRTKNPYLHLLLGCGAFLTVTSIPWIGGLVMFAVTVIAIGSLFSTRLAGLLGRNMAGQQLV